MIFQLKRSGKIISITSEHNSSSEELSILTGFNFLNLVDPSDSATARKFLAEIEERSEPVICQIKFSLEHHSMPLYHCIGIPSTNDRICVVAKKLEESNLLSDQLSEAKQRMRVLFDKLPVSLLVVNSACRIEAVNPTAEKMFGYSGQVWQSLALYDLLSVPHRQASRDLFELLGEAPGRINRLDGLSGTGTKFYVEASAEFMDSTGKRLLLSIFDISDRIQLEKLKTEFVEMVSHDLRTPLTNLSLFLECISCGLYKSWSTQKLEESAEKNSSEVGRLIRLINKLLELDKLERGFDKPVITQIWLTDLIPVAVEAVSNYATASNITFVYEFEDHMLLADPDQLTQILVNLLGNAIKFSPHGGTIKVVGNSLPAHTELQIIDDGPGIPEELQAHIFERFGQVQNSKSKDGTGLGLAICRSLVEGHGGTIGVFSEPGKGSTFWIRIPREPHGAESVSDPSS